MMTFVYSCSLNNSVVVSENQVLKFSSNQQLYPTPLGSYLPQTYPLKISLRSWYFFSFCMIWHFHQTPCSSKRSSEFSCIATFQMPYLGRLCQSPWLYSLEECRENVTFYSKLWLFKNFDKSFFCFFYSAFNLLKVLKNFRFQISEFGLLTTGLSLMNS